ncbi:alpha-glucuronidase family glycosyl hydrolase [Lederbergia lenta]|uniref:Xylan alpha-1,2-glucuronidase n=1 Tax=Lederbergia lenta TaxID=1467 RepID=A0A2X4VP70_LEDLE|nr:alpha-glucuronidase family glycosyl hydrolase [Lederbergia lenta]MEC2325700.1 alpha-glucuronidase family glycosyl hydrolase [Lederbergia lenta]SQI53916.1 alpha-glucuronidase [Lederbergia lenta]
MQSLRNKIVEEQGYKAWLQYTLKNDKQKDYYSSYLRVITYHQESEVIDAATKELSRAVKGMLGISPEIKKSSIDEQSEGVLLTLNSHTSKAYQSFNKELDRYQIEQMGKQIIISSNSDKGILYGVFHLLRIIQSDESIEGLLITEKPRNQLRMINQWDNMDGSIERGYAGSSIFYQDNQFIGDEERVEDYARLLSSVGINAISINNVNVHKVETTLITDLLPEVKKTAAIFRKYGITLFLSINYSSPIEIGGLTTADPLDQDVQAWWAEAAKNIYTQIPDFGGFVVKADSEHRPGPFTYGRDHTDGANMLAEALKPHGGIVIWRCFVYNCLQDWRDRKTDRARAAYDHFHPLDGQFADNVILQVKNGPMDFQVREPVSPLIGALKKTNHLLELQVTQEYTGQQKHLCYLVPQWKEVLDFDTYANGEGTEIHNIIAGDVYDYQYSGLAAVSNIGADLNWTGHDLAQANLYGYGRLCWNPTLDMQELTLEWIHQTFGKSDRLVDSLLKIMLQSWETYEKYTAPLGVGWMVNPHHHYGPNVDGYEYSVWGTYHYADRDGVGVDRTMETGTGYTEQYYKPNADIYNSLTKCPDELILFFHHVPYTHQLQSGKTVIQTIYDTHFEGVEDVKALLDEWLSMEGEIDEQRFKAISQRLSDQFEHSKQWRDMINTYFYRKSGIKDEQDRLIY